MQITSTYLKSKTARQIALLLLVAVLIPSALMTGLLQKKIDSIIGNYEHKLLEEKSRSYALSVFENLIFARSSLQQAASLSTDRIFHLKYQSFQIPMFSALATIGSNGKVTRIYRDMAQPLSLTPDETQQIIEASKRHSSSIVILPVANTNKNNIVLLHPHANTIIVAKINPDFLWGKKADYPSDINLCIHHLEGKKKYELFCSSGVPKVTSEENTIPNNLASWELFMRAEFGADSWIFETTRLYASVLTSNEGVFDGVNYMAVGILSVLLIGLLSLIQIRKTMVPLEDLIAGTKRLSLGDFSPIKIRGGSEFSQLGDAFNSMSVYIKRQLDTFRSLSLIDQEIASKLDFEQLAEQITARMLQLKPDTSIYIFRLDEKTGAEVQCSVSISGNGALSSMRLPLSHKEFNMIKTYGQGRIAECSMGSHFAHERLAAELGNHYLWAIPIYWQGEMSAFVAVGSKTLLSLYDPEWLEFRELANRIGVVIAAEMREQLLLTQAQYDALTGLPNRILLQDRLRQAMEHSDRSGYPIWVLFIDLDRFKYVNDSMGHHAGDDLLIQIAKRLQSCTRESDTVARFGGDEFIIVLQGDIEENVRLGVLNRITQTVAMPAKINGQELTTTCSVGVSIYPGDGSNTDALIKHADIAMYRAKELGKNNYQFFTQSMNEKAAKRLRMETLLRKAFDKEEFSIHYQPKVDLVSREIVGMEALIRWDNSELGAVSPANFIPMAEETGLILEIGEWVMRKACTQSVAWQKAGLGELLMSINLSARQFNQENLAGSIKAILVDTGLKAECLEIELTESLFIQDSDNALKILHEIKSLGVKLSIDDFGTGYSNLSYINSLPLDALKIDKAFIDEITLKNNNAPIVDTIIILAKNMNLGVIAEGVESLKQVNYLMERGCDQIQGFYFSRPQTADKIETLLASNKKLVVPNLKPVIVQKKRGAH